MSLLQNDWNAIRAFYREAERDILAAGANEWGIDTYLWDNGMLHMTPIEAWLWHDIRANDAVLYPQYPVARYFVDFGNPVAKVAIECDGAAYHTDREKDARRDAELARIGWTVYRAPGWLCRTDFNEETREIGQAFTFIRDICDMHGISRFSRRARRGEPLVQWASMESMAQQVFESLTREREILDAARRSSRRHLA